MRNSSLRPTDNSGAISANGTSKITISKKRISEKRRVAIAFGLALGMFVVVSDAWSMPSAASCSCSGEDCVALQGLLDSGAFFCGTVIESTVIENTVTESTVTENAVTEITDPASVTEPVAETPAAPTGDAYADYMAYMTAGAASATEESAPAIANFETAVSTTMPTSTTTTTMPPTPPPCSDPTNPELCMQEMMDWYEEYWENLDDTSL